VKLPALLSVTSGVVCSLTLGLATPRLAAAEVCRQKLSAAEQVVALNAISNLMGRYSHLGVLRGEDTLASLFAMKQPDVSWRTPMGPQGPEGMRGRFKQPGEAPRGLVPGQLHEHSMFSPVIEIAADGQTAKGVWDSFGPNIGSGNEVGSWLWVKYGVDFIKEDGQWKIWHLQVYPLFVTPFNESITDSARHKAAGGGGGGGGPPPGGAPGAGPGAGPARSDGAGAAMGGPGQNWKAPKDLWIYDGKSAVQGPRVPEPYCTFDPKDSVGNI